MITVKQQDYALGDGHFLTAFLSCKSKLTVYVAFYHSVHLHHVAQWNFKKRFRIWMPSKIF